MLTKFSKSELFSRLQKVDYVTNYCKRPISLIFSGESRESDVKFDRKANGRSQWFCREPVKTKIIDWKTQTNEFYIIKGRQKFAGKRFSLSGVSNQLNKDYFTG